MGGGGNTTINGVEGKKFDMIKQQSIGGGGNHATTFFSGKRG
jgi:hypothetical protein